MFLHLGGDVVVPLREVVAIFDRGLLAQSRAAEEFLKTTKDEGLLLDVSAGHPKSFVLTTDRVYLSQISSLTLKKRAENVTDYFEELSEQR
ncbi:MAG: DUF370 domain-containing protein [Bacillota bacterium]|nr:DUF370 domain-containing protein [Bacillota bacterium]